MEEELSEDMNADEDGEGEEEGEEEAEDETPYCFCQKTSYGEVRSSFLFFRTSYSLRCLLYM